MNAIFQEYKRQVDECRVVLVDDLDLPFEVKSIEFKVDEKGKYYRPEKKKEDQQLIKEYYEDDEEER